MSAVVFIAGSAPGYQARAYVSKTAQPVRLTRFYAVRTYGPRKARWLAQEALPDLERRASRLRRLELQP